MHEIHSVPGRSGEPFEELLRERWAPAVARDEGTKLAWCVRSMPGGAHFPELITMTAVADGAALERLALRMREGDLQEDLAALDAGRAAVTRRILAPLEFSPLEVDLDALPPVPEPSDGSEMFVHDFVAPRLGMQRVYEKAMRQVLMKMIEMEGIQVAIWAGFETVTGGGPFPQSLMISHIRSAPAGTEMIYRETPRSEVVPGSWMFEGLKLRDTWTSRLVRSVSWSPIG